MILINLFFLSHLNCGLFKFMLACHLNRDVFSQLLKEQEIIACLQLLEKKMKSKNHKEVLLLINDYCKLDITSCLQQIHLETTCSCLSSIFTAVKMIAVITEDKNYILLQASSLGVLLHYFHTFWIKASSRSSPHNNVVARFFMGSWFNRSIYIIPSSFISSFFLLYCFMLA